MNNQELGNNQEASISWDKRKESVQLEYRRGPLLRYSLLMTDTRYSLLALASLSGYFRMPIKEIFFVNRIFLALNLSVQKAMWCSDTFPVRGYSAFFTGARNVAPFMINFQLERMGKLFLARFQTRTSQAFSTLFATS